MEPPERTHDLPSISHIIEQLIAELSTINAPETQNTNEDAARLTAWPQDAQTDIQNPFSSLQGPRLSKVKSLMLTLHCLFPNELLLALDILDRKLVRRFIGKELDENGQDTPAAEDRSEIADSQDDILSQPETTQARDEIFLVLSTSSATSESSRGVPEKYYEVRLHAWNCTCPAFVLNTFRNNPGFSLDDDGASHSDENEEMIEHHDEHWLGGTLTRILTRNSAPPMCKHLLSCILATRCPGLFGGGLQERVDVGQNELAGWAAGWGG